MDTDRIRCSDRNCDARIEVDRGTIYSGKPTCPYCLHTWKRSTGQYDLNPSPRKLFAIEFLDQSQNGTFTTKFRKADNEDIDQYKQAMIAWDARCLDAKWMRSFLDATIPTKDRRDARPISYGFRKYSQLFNPRQLLAISYIGEAIDALPNFPEKDLLLLAMSDCLAANNMLCSYAFDLQKVNSLFGLHGFQIVTRPVENNVWGTVRGRGSFLSCIRKVRRGIASKVTSRTFPLSLQQRHQSPS